MSNETRESRRRNKVIEPLERGYGCPCGKTYLSYPALFTHIKQKHDGKPPGEITKPKSQQTRRGRPRTSSISLTQAEDPFEMDDNPLEHIQEVFENQEEQATTTLSLTEIQPGRNTAIAVLNLFLKQSLPYLSEQTKPILSGFLEVVKNTIDSFNGNDYCQNNNASQIIQSANQIVRQCNSRQKTTFNMSRAGVIRLIKLFFEWLYKSNLTDHIIQDQTNAKLQP